MWDLKNLFSSEQFIPHGHCYLWKQNLVGLHIMSDVLIALAYYSIPIMLVYFVHKRRDLPFSGIFWLFGAFIVSCGTTHIMEVWTLWHPAYWLSGSLKAATATVSLYTAAELYDLIPQALAFPSPGQLQETNKKLALEVMERKLALKALEESETRFRSIFENAAIGISLGDMTGRIVAINTAAQRMLGYSESEMYELSLKDISHPEDLASSSELLEELLAGKRDYYQLQKRYIRKDRQVIWVNITVSLVRDTKGKPQFCIGMVEDISASKQAEAALRQYQEHLEELVGERTVELTKANERLWRQAHCDALTGLVNRREFENRLEEAVTTARGENQEHTLCYLDLDRFKIVNDTCGHLAGDELLRQVSALLKTKCRKSDILARLGGDEFAVLLYQCSQEQALRVAETLLESVRAFRFACQDKLFSIGVSIGLVAIDADSTSLDVLGAADAACYAAKNNGRNCVYVYQADDRLRLEQQSEMQWATRLERAIALDQFRLYYQPIVPLGGSKLKHYEILLRLVDETGDVILPMAFLPAAERYNLMPAIDRWVIRTFFASMQNVEGDRIYALNLSGATLNDDQFINFLQEQFFTYQIPPQMICFEITETVAIANLNKAAALIHKLKALGCRFALDDFGCGMSSFTYLKYLPVDYLKIAGAFVKDIASDPIACAIVEATNRIGHTFGVETIAEYVTNDVILDKVKTLGIDYAQGYGIAKPQPILDFGKVRSTAHN